MSAGKEEGERPLKELLSKINHPLSDVRCRSLRSLSFKLKNGLVSMEDLVGERGLLIGLLEWFNQEEWSCEATVLSLLQQLTQHGTAAQTVVEVGGVEFLSQLRLHCDPALHSIIDGILEQLLKLPLNQTTQTCSLSGTSSSTTLTSFEHPEVLGVPKPVHISAETSGMENSLFSSLGSKGSPCANMGSSALSSTSTVHTSDVGSYMEISRESFGLGVGVDGRLQPVPQPQSLEQHPMDSQGVASRDTPVAVSGQLALWTKSSVLCSGSTRQDQVNMYSESRLLPHSEPIDVSPERPREFPWIPLTDNDRSILLTTQSRLQSCSDDSLLRSCEFIEDVLLKDFPAEVFLQRPAIIKSLLVLLDQSGGQSVALPALLSCLAELVSSLQHRREMVRDPSLALRDTLGGTASMVNTTSPSTTHALESLPPEMLSQLQSEQLTTSQFNVRLLNSVSSLLPTLLARDSNNGVGGCVSCEGGSVVKAIALCVKMLCSVCEIMEQENKEQKVAKGGVVNTNPQIEGAVDSLCSALSQCLSRWRKLSSQVKEGVFCPQLQVVCSVTLHLTQALCCVMTIYPVDTVVPLPSVLSGVMMNGVLGLVCPSLLEQLLPVFERVDAPSCRLYRQAHTMSESFKAMSQSLSQPSPLLDNSLVTESLSLVAGGLEGLWFAPHREFVKRAMELCYSVLTEPDSPCCDTALGLVLRLVGHGSVTVREHAYKKLQEQYEIWLVTIRESIDIDLSAHPLLNSDLLTEICCHGVVSESQMVADSACKIMAWLLSLEDEEGWCAVWSRVEQWMPFLKLAMSCNAVLCSTLQQLLEGERLKHSVRLGALIRLLHSNSTQLRVWSLRQLSVLVQEGNPPPPWLHTATTPLHDLLTVGDYHGGLLHNTQGAVQHEDVLKLVRILRSPSMDRSLKNSALEQLSLILRDRQLHAQVVEDNIHQDLLSTLVSHSRPQEESPDGLVKPCVKCLLPLTISSPQLREKVNGDAAILQAILSAAMYFNEDTEFLPCVSMLLAMCLYDQVVMVTEDGQIQLPQVFCDKLKFPFPVEKYQLEQCHITPSPLDPALFTSDPLLSMLRLSYHSAMVGPIDQLITAHQNNTLHCPDTKLIIPYCDVAALSGLCVAVCLREYLSLLRSASTHGEVVGVLCRLEVVLRTWCVCGEIVVLEQLNSDWRKAFEKFLCVSPSSPDDLSLLSTVLTVLQTLALVSQARPLQPALPDYLIQGEGLGWLVEVTCSEEAVCLQLLNEYTEFVHKKKQSDQYRHVLKRTLGLIGTLVCHTPATPLSWVTLTETVCECVQLAGSPEHYDLPLLETALECLLHLSACDVANKLMKREKVRKTLLQVMITLRQVLWSLISSRGRVTLSFLGRGVTSLASLALSHIVQKASQLEQPKGWWLQWLESSPAIELSWLRYLVEDRDPQICYSGFSLLSLLCSQSEVVETLLGVWRDSPCGLWGVCLESTFHTNISDLVRQQALFVLVSLSSVCNSHKKWTNYLVCAVDDSEGPLTGEKALEHILQKYSISHQINSVVQSDNFSKLSEETESALTLLENSSYEPPTSINNHSLIISSNTSSEDRGFSHLITMSSSDQISKEAVDAVLRLVRLLIDCCSPLFVCGVCKLLHNMVLGAPQVIGEYLQETGLLDSLIRLFDASIFKLFLLSAAKGIIRPHLLSGWVRMLEGVADLLRALLPLHPSLVHSLFPCTVGQLWGVLSTVGAYGLKDTDCLTLCSKALELMLAAVQCSDNSFQMIRIIFKSFQKYWNSFAKLCLCSLKSSELMKLRTHCLKALSLVLMNSAPLPREIGVVYDTEGVFRERVTDLNKILEKDHTLDCEKPTGWVLCSAMLEAPPTPLTTLTPLTPLTTLTAPLTEALKIMLASSDSAKQAALANGLLESAMDQLKSLGAKVKSEQNDQVTQSGKKSLKDSPAVLEYINICHLIRNFMYKSSEVKYQVLMMNHLQSAVADSQLLTIIHRHWSWASLHRKLLVSVLKLLSVFTANHPRGQSLLCQPGRCVQPTTSLLHSSLKLCSAQLSATNQRLLCQDLLVLGGVFSLLTNCALCQEGRAVIRKVGFLVYMGALDPKSDKGQRSTKLTSLWVPFLANLSFSNDGQQMIIKQSGSLEVMTELYWSSSGSIRTRALLLLRNLCFYGPSKALLASDESFQSVLSHSLRSEESTQTALATSALWALLHNCTKIRNVLRQTELVESLESLHTKSVATKNSQCSDNHLKALNMAYLMLH